MDTLFAFDIFGSSSGANETLEGRVAQSGYTWTRGRGTGAMTVTANDTAVGTAVKGVSSGSAGGPNVFYLPAASNYLHSWARGRAMVMNITASAKWFFGIGFCDKTGAGYFGGWYTNATPQLIRCIAKVTAAGVISNLLGAPTPVNFASPYHQEIKFEYHRDTGFMQMYRGGAGQGFATDTDFRPIYPALAAGNIAGGAAPNQHWAETLFFGVGVPTSQEVLPVWSPIGIRDYLYTTTLDFSLSPLYDVALETTLDGSRRIRAYDIVLASYDATAPVSLVVDGATVNIPVGRELVLRAPLKPSVRIQGSLGAVALRLYTMPYSIYQRD